MKLEKKLHIIFQTACKEKHDTLVLGALGGCPPTKKSLQSTMVYFAVLGANYNFFSTHV